ncbi:MAG TPA: acyl-CoA dehydrogenase family protein, partial [Stellaceae bacterium]|nr:acyl-CoA dehydrogenase family protein [Stellaceae bacterium]
MDFEYTEEQRLLRESLDRLLGDSYEFAKRKTYMAEPDGFSRAMWTQYGEIGLLGLPFAEEHGGFGGGGVEIMVVMEALGRVIALEPYLTTVVMAGTALGHAGSAAQNAALVPKVIDGSLRLAVAHGERQARYDLSDVMTSATKTAAGWRLDGSKSVVVHGDSADKLIVSARVSGDRNDPDGIGLFLVDPKAAGVARRAYKMRDGTNAADIAFSGV